MDIVHLVYLYLLLIRQRHLFIMGNLECEI